MPEDSRAPESASSTDYVPAHNPRSTRRLTFWRMLSYRMAALLASLILETVWRTSRIRILGLERLQAMLDEHPAVILVCWHQHLLLSSRFIARCPVRGMTPGALISPSVDGEGPSMLAALYKVRVVRGSSTHTGSQAVRALFKVVSRDRVSPLLTPDGPRGPRFEFKPGAIGIAQLAGVPIVPLAWAARSAKVLRTWDRFVLAWPFNRIVIAVGEPVTVPRRLDEAQMQAMQQDMQRRMLATFNAAREILHKR